MREKRRKCFTPQLAKPQPLSITFGAKAAFLPKLLSAYVFFIFFINLHMLCNLFTAFARDNIAINEKAFPCENLAAYELIEGYYASLIKCVICKG